MNLYYRYCSVSHLKLEQIAISMGTILKCAEWLGLGERGWGRREESSGPHSLNGSWTALTSPDYSFSIIAS